MRLDMAKFLIPVVLLTGLAQAQEELTSDDIGLEVSVELTNGDKVSGTLLGATESRLIIQSPVFGRVEIPRSNVKVPEPEPVEPVEPWTGTFDLSLAGARGSNQNQTFRTALDLRHDSDELVETYGFSYTKSTAEVDKTPPAVAAAGGTVRDTDVTADRFYAIGRREWRFDDSLWRPFVQGTGELDRLNEDWNYRIGLHTGAAYPLIALDDGTQELTALLGAGASREFGGSDESWTPEGLLGLNYFVHITSSQRFAAGVTAYPNLEDQGEYRAIGNLEYQADIATEEEDNPWHLKAGMQLFYDSDPEDPDPTNALTDPPPSTDKTYYFGLGYAF